MIETKLIAPARRPGTVARDGLLDRIGRAEEASVIAVAAPAGYGKTTLLAQLIARERRPVAWVSVGERDNDPEHVVLLDDVHLLSETLSRDAIASLALHVRQGSQLVVSGRSSDCLPIARLR